MAERQPSPDDPPQIREMRYLLAPFSICTQWGRSEHDEVQDYEQLVSLRAPDGRETPVGEPMPLSFDRPVHRVLQQAHVTCRMTGTYTLLLGIRPAGTEDWQMRATFPIIIEDFVVPPPEFPNSDVVGQLAVETAP